MDWDCSEEASEKELLRSVVRPETNGQRLVRGTRPRFASLRIECFRADQCGTAAPDCAEQRQHLVGLPARGLFQRRLRIRPQPFG